MCSEYDVILLPEFSVKQMTWKRGEGGEWQLRINRSTVCRMLLWGHYQFKMRLLAKAKQWGKTVVVVGEGYTSKTCGECGWQHQKLGGNKVFKCGRCGFHCDRDLNGARNILLRATCMTL